MGRPGKNPACPSYSECGIFEQHNWSLISLTKLYSGRDDGNAADDDDKYYCVLVRRCTRSGSVRKREHLGIILPLQDAEMTPGAAYDDDETTTTMR